jgi:hypothetical protein
LAPFSLGTPSNHQQHAVRRRRSETKGTSLTWQSKPRPDISSFVSIADQQYNPKPTSAESTKQINGMGPKYFFVRVVVTHGATCRNSITSYDGVGRLRKSKSKRCTLLSASRKATSTSTSHQSCQRAPYTLAPSLPQGDGEGKEARIGIACRRRNPRPITDDGLHLSIHVLFRAGGE